MAVMTDSRSFEIVQSEGSLGRNLPQRLGRALSRVLEALKTH